MKKIMKIMLLCMTVFSFAYAQKIQQSQPNKGTLVKESILSGKPSFKLSVSSSNAEYRIYLNGVKQIEEFSGLNINLEYPVNGYIQSGKNKITILLTDSNSTLTDCTVTLNVHTAGDFNTPSQNVVTLSYKQGVEDHTANSSKSGNYSFSKGFIEDAQGDVTVFPVTIKEHTPSDAYRLNAKFIDLEFSLPMPFPKWHFFDGEEILDKDYLDLSMAEFLKLQKEDEKIKKLIDLNHEIYNAAKNKDIDKLMSFFTERNNEMDIAYYYSKGSTLKEGRKSLLDTMNNGDLKLLEKTEEDWKNYNILFFVEPNNKLAYIDNLLVWNHIKGQGSESYDMKFRYEKGKWILTR